MGADMSERIPRPATPTVTTRASAAYPDAACHGMNPETWFPSKGDRMTKQRAKAICKGCPAREVCLADAMEVEHGSSWNRWGVFGGLGPGQRARLARRVIVAAPKTPVVRTEPPGKAYPRQFVASTLGARRAM